MTKKSKAGQHKAPPGAVEIRGEVRGKRAPKPGELGYEPDNKESSKRPVTLPKLKWMDKK